MYKLLFILCISPILLVKVRAAEEIKLSYIGSWGQKHFYTSSSPNATYLSWMEAQEFCNQVEKQTKLASIETNEELTLVTDYMGQQNISMAMEQFWVSGTDFGSEGNYTWTQSGNRVEFKIVEDFYGTLQNCLKLQLDSVFFDEYCTDFRSPNVFPLCESKIGNSFPTDAPPQSTTPNAPTSLPPFFCESEGSFPDPYKCSIYHVCVAFGGGFTDYEMSCPLGTVFCDEEKICGNNEFCPCDKEKVIDFTQEASDKIKISRFNSSVEMLSVGKINTTSYYTAKIGNLDWYDSLRLCHENGMMLAKMETQAERNLFLNYLGISSGSPNYFWLSGLDYGSEGSYYWMSRGSNVTYSVYGNGGRQSNCLYLAGIGPLYDWPCRGYQNQAMWPLCQLN